MRLHKEGNLIIPIAAVLIAVLYFFLTWLLPFLWAKWILGVAALVFFGLIVHFFRHPKVESPQGDQLVVAPAEGKIVVIEETEEPEFLEEKRIQISIFMSPLNVHVNRSPVKGKINYYKYHPGKYLVAWHPKSSTENERTSIGYELASGTSILMRQIAGAVARRIRFYKSVGDPVNNGEEVGFIRFGSRVDVFLPLDANLKVKVGETTQAGTTVLAEL
jgi:phosphatidylserine decarboxylase